jgi:2-dehydro-3-deoxyglucarate aldolase/4-hydroxy-2-oxoheptanedioate aldolase
MLHPNTLKRHLAAGHVAVGAMVVEIRQPSIMQVLKNGGLDWVIIDNEHGPFSIETVADLSRAARGIGLTPIVRVPTVSYEHIARSLDAGAQGLMLPRIKSADEVRSAVDWMKYPPRGVRGSTLSRGHTNFLGGDVASVMQEANEETFLVVQIETREAVDHLDEIVSVPGVDAALIGPNDLAIALGVTGRMRDPMLEDAIERTLAACRHHHVFPAIHTNDVALTGEWAKRGMRLVSINSEVGLLTAAVKQAAESIRATAAS